jgi:hypothetical protein
VIDLIFSANRFNLSEEKPHFINPCCFGEDFAAWMRGKLQERGIHSTGPDQEDWGWYIEAKLGDTTYTLGFGGNSLENPEDPNFGEWHVMVSKDRSFKDKLLGKNKMDHSDEMLETAKQILESEGWEPEFDPPLGAI